MTFSTKTILTIAISISASLAIVTSYSPESLTFWILKPVTTILIISLLVFLAEDVPDTRLFDRKIIVIGLVFCLAGDVFLLKDTFFVYGLSAFFVAHLLFSWVFLRLSDNRLYLIPLTTLLAVSGAYFWFLLPNLGALAIPVACYLCCIIFMCWQSYRVYLSRKNNWALTLSVAATLFVLSDSMIAFNKFLLPFEASNALILATYWLSITLVAWLFSTNFHKSTSVAVETTTLENDEAAS